MFPASLAVVSHNAVLECSGFIIYDLSIDDGGAVLVIQKCDMVPRNKVHRYFLVTVLQTQQNICPFHPPFNKQYVKLGFWDPWACASRSMLKNMTLQKLDLSSPSGKGRVVTVQTAVFCDLTLSILLPCTNNLEEHTAFIFRVKCGG
jgi:hypothetical protein